ncbi:hypothetical protein QCA50_016341 [Cerrena zonata]|uniref:DUF6534 domain-containing protein n=1 Tax=Cerrena zonata TaxID=2478898 RepID=A0AAW0FQQ8_9APHY
MALVAHTIYWYTITNFTDPTVVVRIPWTIPAGIIVTPLSDTIVRTFFTYRVWIMSRRNIWLTGTIILGVVAMFGIGFGFGIKAFSLPTFEQFAELAWLLYLGLALVVVVDAFIAISLCIYLWQSRTGFSMRTDSLVALLMVYTVNTGLLTSIFSLACFITYAAMPKNYIFLALYFPLSKLYINALLATLNARDSLKREVQRPTSSGSTTDRLTNIRTDDGIPLEFKTVISQMESGVSTPEQDRRWSRT